MSLSNEPYHFQANLIWWDSPFKNKQCQKSKRKSNSETRRSRQREEEEGAARGGECWTDPLLCLMSPVGG
jgi:hypothetical protein